MSFENDPVYHGPPIDPQWAEIDAMISGITTPDRSQAAVEYISKEEQLARTKQQYANFAHFYHEAGIPPADVKELFTHYTVFQSPPPENKEYARRDSNPQPSA